MVVLEKGNTQSQIVVTISENVNQYVGETFDPTISAVNDLYGNTYSIYPIVDLSATPGRYNLYEIDETQYDFRTGMHTYTFYMNPTSSSILEIGKWNVIGTVSSTQSIYYGDIYQ